jgi:hypothetical protein
MSGATRLPPDILIVQDKSGSMDDSADGTCTSNCGAKSKWSQVTAALNQVVGMTDTTVNWGLKFFSDNGHCGANGAPAVAVKNGNASAITSTIGMTKPGGNTPTRDAVATGAAYLMGLSDTNAAVPGFCSARVRAAQELRAGGEHNVRGDLDHGASLRPKPAASQA